MKCKIFYCLVFFFSLKLVGQKLSSNELFKKTLEEHVWDLSSLYKSNEHWAKERTNIKTGVTDFGNNINFKINTSNGLLRLLDSAKQLSVMAGRMSVYGYLVSTVNETSEKTKRQNRIGRSLETRVNDILSVLPEKILAINQDSLSIWMSRPEYDPYRRQINEIRENKDHFLFGNSSQINNSLKRWSQQSYNSYEELRDSNISWPKVDDSTTIHFNNYRIFFSKEDPKIRTESLCKFFNKLKDFEDVFGIFFTNRIEADHLRATNEKYDNGIEAIFSKRDGYSDKIVDNMIKATKDSIHVFHEMFDLMLQFSESENPSFPDIYYARSKFNSSLSFPIAKTLQRAVDIFSPMGKEYAHRLVRRLNDNRMHLPLLPEKSGGAFAVYPSVGGMKSFLVLPYYGSYATSSALTGGLALLMAYSDMPKERPFLHRYDPPIYSNAVIYAGRLLHDDYLFSNAKDDAERLTYLMNAQFNTFRSFFNYVVFADFERTVQKRVADGETPTGRQISEIYLEKMREYYGHDSVMEVPEFLSTNWINYNVLFSSYDQMFWPPAYACGIQMTEGFQQREKNIMQLFSGVLGNRFTDRTKDLIGDMIDLESEGPYIMVVERIKNQVRQAKKLVPITTVHKQ